MTAVTSLTARHASSSFLASTARLVRTLAALASIALFATGCATPVGVSRLDQQAANRKLEANVLSTGKPSAYSTQILERTALRKHFKKDPEAVLARLNSDFAKPGETHRLFALSELSFAHAEASSNQSYYLASAVYAYAFLFPKDPTQTPEPYDPRRQVALDLYNRGVALGLATADRSKVDLSDRELRLPFGSLSLGVNPAGFNYAGNKLTDFVSLSDFKVRGLRNTYHTAGIGATLSAGVEPTANGPASRWIPAHAKVPITAFVRFDDPLRAMRDGRLQGVVELYDEDRTPAVQIDSYSVPIAADPSAALAYRLEGSSVWDFEIAGFRHGDFGSSDVGDTASGKGVFMLHPYHPHLIPLVFVHGTASSPARWAEMANELLGDPAIRSRYQIWFFIYNSGNPIALSAMRLRESLKSMRRDIDPEGTDDALDQMVVIGHSQGGLLAKMMVVTSGTQFWDNFANVPFDQADLKADTRELLTRAIFVEPLPFVKRVIFIATPHRGSYIASNPIAKFANKFINLPGSLAKAAVDMGKVRKPSLLGAPATLPTALDNMDASNPFLKTLGSLPIVDGVHVHSIIAVKGEGPLEDGNDGVVEYKSAHIDGVESELIVRSGHSTQATPETIEEVRRILYEHADIH